MLYCPERSPFNRSSRFPGGTANSASSLTRLIWVSFLRATAHKSRGQAARASLLLTPSKTSSVPLSAKERITPSIITADGSSRQATVQIESPGHASEPPLHEVHAWALEH